MKYNKFLNSILLITILTIGFQIQVNAKLFGPKTPNGNDPKYNIQTCSTPAKNGDWVESCKLSKFDSIDGELRKVYIEMVVGTKTDIDFLNTGLDAFDFKIDATTDVKLVDKVSQKEVINIKSIGSKTFNLKANEALKQDGFIVNEKPGDVILNYTSVADKALFDSFKVGSTGIINEFEIKVDSNVDIVSSGNANAKIQTFTEIKSVKFIYEYYKADLSISKSHSPNKFQEGKPGLIKLLVKNNNDEATTDIITVEDPLPSYLKFVSQTNPDWKCESTPTLKCTSSKSIPPLGSSTIELNVDVMNNLPKEYLNTAKVKYPKKEYDEKNNTSVDVIIFIKPPESYDCNLGQFTINENININSVNDKCLRGTTDNPEDKIVKFIITRLPDPSKGILIHNGNPITLNQVIKPSEENKLIVIPAKDYIGEVSFQYTVEDSNEMIDKSPATVKANYIKEKELIRTGGFEKNTLTLIFIIAIVGLMVLNVKNKKIINPLFKK
jgi:Domain of unknown function DUF11